MLYSAIILLHQCLQYQCAKALVQLLSIQTVTYPSSFLVLAQVAIEGQLRLDCNTFLFLALLRPRIYKVCARSSCRVFLPLQLTIQSFRAEKLKPRKFSKLPKKQTIYRNKIVDALEFDEDNIAIVAYSKCVKYNVIYYYNRRQLVQYTAYLRYQQNCDSTFSLKEFQKVRIQKKKLKFQTRDEY